MKANNPKERSQVVVEKMKKDINDPEANRAWHRKHRRMKSQLDRIGRIIDWEINKDNARPENKDRKWAIERLIEKNIILNVKKNKAITEEEGKKIAEAQIKSLEPWLGYLKAEDFSLDFKMFVLRNILLSQEAPNGKMYGRGKNCLGMFPKFDLDTVNRVLPIMTDIMRVDVYDDYGFNLEDYEEIKKVLRGKTGSQRNRFAEAFEKIDELTKPKEYKDFSKEVKIHSFVSPLFDKEKLEQNIKEVVDLCRNSKSFCIRGEEMVRSYFKKGDLAIFKRLATNVHTGKEEPVPEVAIHLTNKESPLGTYTFRRILEIGGNEEFQDLHPRNAEYILGLLKQFTPEIDELEVKKNMSEEENVILNLCYFFKEPKNLRKLENVLTWGRIQEKIKTSDAKKVELDISELRWLHGLDGHLQTFAHATNGVNPKIDQLVKQRDLKADYRKIFSIAEDISDDEILISGYNAGFLFLGDVKNKKFILGVVFLTDGLGGGIGLEDLTSLKNDCRIVGSLKIRAKAENIEEIKKILKKKNIKVFSLQNPTQQIEPEFVLSLY
jgi:hypothetical protein